MLLCKGILVHVTAESARLPHYMKESTVSPQETLCAVPVSDILSVCLLITFTQEDKSFVCTLPNKIERD